MAVIPTIADILLGQFQAESAVRWQAAYGAFCSQHSDSVAIYKDLLKSDRRQGGRIQGDSRRVTLLDFMLQLSSVFL